MNKIKSVLHFVDNNDFWIEERALYTNVHYKNSGHGVGSEFYNGERRNKFSLSFTPDSELEKFLSMNYRVEKSDNGQHSIVWFDLNDSKDFDDLIQIFNNVLPHFESSMRKLYERH